MLFIEHCFILCCRNQRTPQEGGGKNESLKKHSTPIFFYSTSLLNKQHSSLISPPPMFFLLMWERGETVIYLFIYCFAFTVDFPPVSVITQAIKCRPYVLNLKLDNSYSDNNCLNLQFKRSPRALIPSLQIAITIKKRTLQSISCKFLMKFFM